MKIRVAIDGLPKRCVEVLKTQAQEVRDVDGRTYLCVDPSDFERVMASQKWEPSRCQGCGG
jgi:hypothetical protein